MYVKLQHKKKKLAPKFYRSEIRPIGQNWWYNIGSKI